MTYLISLLGALCALVFAMIAVTSTRRCAALASQIAGQLHSLRSLVGTTEETAAKVDSLADQLRALRGKFYAERKRAPETGYESGSESAIEDSAALKARLRKQLGLVPGRRP